MREPYPNTDPQTSLPMMAPTIDTAARPPQDETQVHLTFLSMLPSLFRSPEPFPAPPSNAPFKGCLDDQISILQDTCLGSFRNCGNLK